MARNAAATQYGHAVPTVTQGSNPDVASALAVTGFDVLPMFIIGIVLIVAGLGFMRSLYGKHNLRWVFTGRK